MARLIPLFSALPAPDLRPLDAAARAMAPATRRALRADIRIWTAWPVPRDIGHPPLAPHDVADFLRDMWAEGRKAATLARHVSSIATWHRLLDLPDPTRAELVRLELETQRRALGGCQRQATGLRFKDEVADPLTRVGAVGACVEAMLLARPDTVAGARDRALLWLGDADRAFAGRDRAERLRRFTSLPHRSPRRYGSGTARQAGRGNAP